jgi:hypothetical protein
LKLGLVGGDESRDDSTEPLGTAMALAGIAPDWGAGGVAALCINRQETRHFWRVPETFRQSLISLIHQGASPLIEMGIMKRIMPLTAHCLQVWS